MPDDHKWVEWNKPETIVSRLAMEVHIPENLLELLKPGTYKFNDGTTQGWSIDQLYDTNDPNMTQIAPYFDAITKKLFFGFTLSNYQNLGLAASAYPFLTPGSTVKSFDFYLQSPDLAGNSDWVKAHGYSLDLRRNFLSLCADPPLYHVQLQARFLKKKENQITTYSEWDDVTQTHLFHTVKSLQPYHFVWKAEAFTDSNLELRNLRIRFSQPNFSQPGAGECLPRGDWLIGNISPEV